jgi:hypothetical protein
MTEPRTVRLLLTCQNPPPATSEGRPAEFGLQDARQVLHPGDLLPDGGLRFELDVTVKPRAATGAPAFSGPFVHGPAIGRFLYLGWRRIGAPNYIRRYKVPLATITWETLAADGALHGRVSITQAVTLPLLDGGWTPTSP